MANLRIKHTQATGKVQKWEMPPTLSKKYKFRKSFCETKISTHVYFCNFKSKNKVFSQTFKNCNPKPFYHTCANAY